MNRPVRALLIAALASLLALPAVAKPAAAPTPQAWVVKSNENAKLLLEVLAKYGPEGATQLGVDGYDEKILDLSRDQFEPARADTLAVVAELEKRAAAETDARVKQDLEILISAAKDNIHTQEINRAVYFPYIDVTGLVFAVSRGTLDPRVPKEKQKALLKRLEKYAGLAKGYRPLTELAKERTLERIAADPKLIGPYKGQMDQDLGNHPTLIKGLKDILEKSGLKGWEKSYAALETQLTEYNAWLAKDIAPRATASHLLPPAIYADNLKQFGVDVPPEELVAKALTSFAEIRSEMQVIAGLIAKERNLPDPDYRAVIKALKQQQIPADQVLALYEERLGKLEAAMRANRVVTVPDRKSVIKLATEAETAQQPAPHMRPPRLIGNTGEYGVFVLPAGLPPDPSGKQLRYDDFSHQAATWTLTAHESRPGHELQFARMIEAGVSTARAVFAFNSVNVEGWALYAEAEMKPYLPLDGQLFSLQARLQRAARAFLDPMVNTDRIKPDQVTDFLMDEVGLSEAMATQETRRYTFNAPGQATSYFYGYQRLLETRQAAEVALREKFDRQAFNDFVLAQGLVPPKVLRKAVMEEFVPARLAK
jgi:uncharacterized protein (DUF885 family)